MRAPRCINCTNSTAESGALTLGSHHYGFAQPLRGGRDLTKLFGHCGYKGSLTLWMFCQAKYSITSPLPPLLHNITVEAAEKKCQNNNALPIMQTHTAQMLFVSTQPLDTLKLRKRRSLRRREEKNKEDKTFIKLFGRGVRAYECRWRRGEGTNLWRWQHERREERGERKRKRQNKWCDVTE